MLSSELILVDVVVAPGSLIRSASSDRWRSMTILKDRVSQHPFIPRPEPPWDKIIPLIVRT